jgi:alpha-tubulin suppressor-like RCC1 family protein
MEDGSVWMWGKSNMMPMPRTNKAPRRVPQTDFRGEWPTLVVCSARRNYILTDRGTVFSTVSVDGEIDGTVVEQFLAPVVEVCEHYGASVAVKMIATGKYHVLAIGEHCGLWSWGVNFISSLGVGLTNGEEQLHPTPVPVFLTHKMTHVAAGTYHSMAVSADSQHGGLFAWGNGRNGQLGLQRESILDQAEPRRISPAYFDDEAIQSVSCAETCTVVLTVSSKLWMFGEIAVKLSGTVHGGSIIHVAEDDYEDTMAWEWEDTDADVAGVDIGVDRFNPFMYHLPRKMRLDPFRGARIVAVAAGTTHVCIHTENGLLYTWNGLRPALFRPVGHLAMSPVPFGNIVRQSYFGGYGVRVSHRLGRRDAAQFALGRVRNNVEYQVHLRSRKRRLLGRPPQRAVTAVDGATVLGACGCNDTALPDTMPYSNVRWVAPYNKS